MAILPTVKVTLGDGYKIINESDFDAATMTPPSKKAKKAAKKGKRSRRK